MKYRTLSAFPLLLLLAGCFGSQYRDTAYFDLTPSRSISAAPVSIAEFRNQSGAGSRFQYREANGRIVSDPDNKWILPPGALVARALRSALAPAGTVADGAEIPVAGELLSFEIDRTSGKFHLQAQLRIFRGEGRTKILNCDIEVPLIGDKPEDAVRAASLAIGRLAEQVKKAL